MNGQVVIAARTFGRADLQGAELLIKAGLHLIYLPGKDPAGEELAELMRDHRTVAVIAGGEPITAEMILNSPNLKVIAMHGAGINHINQEAVKSRNILLRGVPGGNAEAVADLTFGLMLAVARHIVESDAAIRQHEWGTFMGTSVYGKILGIIGFGAIGQAVARRAAGFSMKILTFDVVIDKNALKKLNVESVTLEDLLENSDFVTLHVPLTPETANLINADALRKMKKSAILINISRGGVIDESALCQALKDGMIAGAGVDTFYKEPLQDENCLRSAPNLVMTPHIGGRTREAIAYIGIEAAKIVIEGLETCGTNA